MRRPLKDLGLSEYGIISAMTTQGGDSDSTFVTPSLTSSVDVDLFRQIALDLQRSFPTHRSLMGDSPEAIEGQAKLFRVLTAYAKYNPKIGYSQGMSYIAAVFLMVLDEEEAFWAMVVLLDKPKYLLEFFDSSLKQVQHQALVFQQLLKHRKPQLYEHMEKLGISSLHFTMQWFLTLFTSLPCWDSVLAIWDLFLLHGVLAVFRVGLAILQLLETRIMSVAEEAAVLPVLLRVPVDVSRYCVLIPALWSIEVQEWEINCMNSLILEERNEEHSTRISVKDSVSPQHSDEVEDEKPAVESPTHNRPCEKEVVDSGGKNVFARLLKVAQRYLADTAKHSSATNHCAEAKQSSAANHCAEAKHSTAAKHGTKVNHSAEAKHSPKTKNCSSVKRRRSQGRCGVVRMEPLPVQGSDGGGPVNGGRMLFRRLKSGSVGRVARRRSGGAASYRTRSIGTRGNAAQTRHQERQQSPCRNISPGHTPLAEYAGAMDPTPANPVRESQLI